MNRYLLLAVAGIWMTVTAAATLIAVAGSESPSQHGLQFVWLVLLGSPWCMFVQIAEPGSVWVYPELVAYSVINLCLLLLAAQLVASVARSLQRRHRRHLRDGARHEI